MAKLMNSSFFMFKMSLLRNYCVKYYDYIVKRCSGIAGDWCASLDTTYNLALMSHIHGFVVSIHVLTRACSGDLGIRFI